MFYDQVLFKKIGLIEHVMIKYENDLEYFIESFAHLQNVIAVESALRGFTKGVVYSDAEDTSIKVFYNKYDGLYLSSCKQYDIQRLKSLLIEILDENKNRFNEYVIYTSPTIGDDVKKIIPVSQFEEWEVLAYGVEKTVFVYETEVSGFEILPIQKKYFTDDYINASIIKEEILSTWDDISSFSDKGFGYLAVDVKEKSIAGYCFSEQITEKAVEFNIEVFEKYQHKGVGTSLGAGMLKRCEEESLKAMWYTQPENVNSIRLAEKLGFSLIEKFNVWYFQYN